MTSQGAMRRTVGWGAVLLLVMICAPAVWCARGGKVKGRTHVYGNYDEDDTDLYPLDENRSLHLFAETHEQRFGQCSDQFPDPVPEDVAGRYIHLLVFPPLMLLGILGNLVAFPVLYSLSKSSWSTARYLALLTITDLVILLVQCGDKWYIAIHDSQESLSYRIMSSSDAACKVYNLALEFAQHMNVWLLVAVAIETSIAARWPHRAHIMCSLERATNVVLLMTILIICLNIHYFWTWGVKRRGMGCQYADEFAEEFFSLYWPVIDILVKTILPLIIVSVFFYFTVSAIVKRKDEEEEKVKLEMSKYFLELPCLFELRNVCVVFCLLFMCITTFEGTLQFAQVVYTRGSKLSCYDEGRYKIMKKLLKTLNWTFKAVFYSMKIIFYVSMCKSFSRRLKDKFQPVASRFRSCQEQSCLCRPCRGACPADRHEWSPVPSASTSADCLGAHDNGTRPKVNVVDSDLKSTHV